VGGSMNTLKDFRFKATDIETNRVIHFTLEELLLSNTPPEIHEEMHYELMTNDTTKPNVQLIKHSTASL